MATRLSSPKSSPAAAGLYYGPPGPKRFWAQAWNEFGFMSQKLAVKVLFT
jgi:hypothetical protein